jgi:Spy/CpxP family protein refolding chaperone
MFKRYALPTFYLLIVFVCGLAAGVFGYRFYELRTVSANAPLVRPPEEWKKRHLKELDSRLHLTDDERTKISAIMDETHAEMRVFMDKTRPELDRIQQTQYARVKAVLTPAQAAEYDKLHAEREQRREAGRKNGE